MSFDAYDPGCRGTFAIINDLRITSILARLLCRFPANDDFLSIHAIRAFYPIIIRDDQRELSDFRFIFRSIRILFFRGLDMRDDFMYVVQRGIPASRGGIIRVHRKRGILSRFFFIIFRTRYNWLNGESCQFYRSLTEN